MKSYIYHYAAVGKTKDGSIVYQDGIVTRLQEIVSYTHYLELKHDILEKADDWEGLSITNLTLLNTVKGTT
jgi:hypothetical protein